MPDLTNKQPRIILAASSFDNQELTSAVLWLRNFGLDITCVELLPYKMPSEQGELVLVPRILIPLPETKNYQVQVERKQALGAAKTKEQSEYDASLKRLEEIFRKISPEDIDFIKSIETPTKKKLSVRPLPKLPLRYGWVIKDKSSITVEISFTGHGDNQQFNKKCLEIVRRALPPCGDESPFCFKLDDPKTETRVYCDVNPSDAFLDDSHLAEAARAMQFLRAIVGCLHPEFENAAKELGLV